jgi:hypothetical protein
LDPGEHLPFACLGVHQGVADSDECFHGIACPDTRSHLLQGVQLVRKAPWDLELRQKRRNPLGSLKAIECTARHGAAALIFNQVDPSKKFKSDLGKDD